MTHSFPTRRSSDLNISDQSIYGVEFQASVSPTRNFTASFNGAYTKVEIDSVSLPPSLPTGVVFDRTNINKYTTSFSGTASVSWTLPFHPADGDLVLDGDPFLPPDFIGQNAAKLTGNELFTARSTETCDGRGGGHR